MEDTDPPKRRFQFTLGTLIMSVITIGALMAVVTLFNQNATLREANDSLRSNVLALRAEAGYLEIGDPNLGWIRPVESDEMYVWRFRIYNPSEIPIRIGCQTEQVADKPFNPVYAKYTPCKYWLGMHAPVKGDLFKGEYAIRVTLRNLPDSTSHLEVKISPVRNDSIPGRFRERSFLNVIELERKDFVFYNRAALNLNSSLSSAISPSTSFKFDAPLILINEKERESTSTSSEDEHTSTKKIFHPGLLLWLEKDPQSKPNE